MSISGSCHCGRVSFTLHDEPAEAMQCNCSICRRKGYLLVFSAPDKFETSASDDDLTTYRFGHGNVRHRFCKTCGCAPFGDGKDANDNPVIAVNLRCADVDLSAVRINEFDGASL